MPPAAKITLFAFLALMTASALRVTRVARGHWPDAAGLGTAAGLWFWHAGLGLVPLCMGLGLAAHLLGDMPTKEGCPLFWPASDRDFHDSPVLFTTGKFFESKIVFPVLVVSLAAALVWDCGAVGWLAAHTTGHLAR